MFEDVIEALSASHDLAGIVVVTVDPTASAIALRYGAKVWTDGARDGHTGAVTAAAHRLAADGSAMLTMPGDIPRATAADIAHVLAAHPPGAAFTIVPAWDERGSNAIFARLLIWSPCGSVLTVSFRISRRHERWV